MTKSELVKTVAEEMNITKKDANECISAVFDQIFESLVNGEDVTISKFGTFRTVEIGERPARNPQTGEPMVVPAHKRVAFKPSSVLKEAVK